MISSCHIKAKMTQDYYYSCKNHDENTKNGDYLNLQKNYVNKILNRNNVIEKYLLPYMTLGYIFLFIGTYFISLYIYKIRTKNKLMPI